MLIHDPDVSLLRLGDLELEQTSPDGMYVLHALNKDSGTDLSAMPDPNTSTLTSAIADGAIVETTGFANIVIPIAVQVLDGPNADPGEGIPQGVAALLAQCRSTWYDGIILPLRWLPSAGFGPPCVWQCTSAKLGAADWDDYDELDPEHRGALYLLELTCAPQAFGDASVTETIPAPSTSEAPTVTEVDDCDYASASAAATAGWSAPVGTLAVGTASPSGENYVYAEQSGSRFAALQRGFGAGLDMADTPYLQVTVSAPYFGPGSPYPVGSATLTFQVNGASVTPLAQSAGVYWLPAPATVFSIQAAAEAPATAARVRVAGFDVSQTDAVGPGTLTQLEVYRQFPVEGSVRTPASISVRGVDPEDGSDAALEQSIVYTTRASGAAVPALRGALVPGPSEVTDTTAYSGKKSALSDTHTFEIPVSSLPSAGYEIAARVQASSTGDKTATWTAEAVVGGETVSEVLTGTTKVIIGAANTWQIDTIALAVLSPTLTGSAGIVRITITSSALTLDDAWLADLDHGQLTIVDCGDKPRLWLDAATFGLPVQTVWIGTAEDRSDAYIPGLAVSSSPQHEVVGGEVVNVFVASASPAEVSLSYPPAAFGRAPKVIDYARLFGTFRGALANADSAPCDMLIVGDSTSEGIGASAIGTRWENVLLGKLRTAAGVSGGEGYVPAYYADPTKTGRFTGGTFTTNGTLFGLGIRCLLLTSGTVSFTFTGTGCDVIFAVGPSGGQFTWKVDGGAASPTQNTYFASAVGGVCYIQARGLTHGSHTITITRSTGTIYVEGAMVYDGDETKGIRLVEAAHSNAQAYNYTALPAWAQSISVVTSTGTPQRVDPALAVIMLGLNDYASTDNARRTAAQFKADLLSIIALIRANTTTDPSFLLVIPWERTTTGTLLSTWAEYRAVYREIAREDDSIALLDLGATIGSFVDGDPNGYSAGDGLHLNDAGYAVVAQAAKALLTGIAS